MFADGTFLSEWVRQWLKGTLALSQCEGKVNVKFTLTLPRIESAGRAETTSVDSAEYWWMEYFSVTSAISTGRILEDPKKPVASNSNEWLECAVYFPEDVPLSMSVKGGADMYNFQWSERTLSLGEGDTGSVKWAIGLRETQFLLNPNVQFFKTSGVSCGKNHSDPSIESDRGQHLQFLQSFYGLGATWPWYTWGPCKVVGLQPE